MNKDLKEAWLAALHSGEYEQGVGELKSYDNKFCCLGVFCDLLAKQGKGEWFSNGVNSDFVYKGYADSKLIPKTLADELGMLSAPTVLFLNVDQHLSAINDNGADFLTIAKLIEEQL